MSTTQIVLLVLGILAVHLAILIPLLVWVKRATYRQAGELAAELARSGERVLIAPTPSVYRGATRDTGLPRAKGNGVAALTDSRLIIRKLVGAGVEVRTADIGEVREDKWFLRAYAGGQQHVIIKLHTGGELGLFVRDNAAWTTALRKLAGT